MSSWPFFDFRMFLISLKDFFTLDFGSDEFILPHLAPYVEMKPGPVSWYLHLGLTSQNHSKFTVLNLPTSFLLTMLKDVQDDGAGGQKCHRRQHGYLLRLVKLSQNFFGSMSPRRDLWVLKVK
jgi:hypothetical protein